MFGPRDSRRVRGLLQALQAQGLDAALVDYADLLLRPELACEALAAHPQALVKLESPGEDPALHAALIERGWRRLGGHGDAPAPLRYGELAHQQHWYAGFADLLAGLPDASRYLNPPADIAAMSDKLACQQRLIAAGVDAPPLLGAIEGYQDLRRRLRDTGCDRVFVKARYGSSGAGVLAYRRHRDGREVAYGSIEAVDEDGGLRLYNSLRPRRYADGLLIARLIDALAAQGAYAERWIAKPRAPDDAGAHYDLRVLALDGRARQRVARVSRSPLTNLHLGNRRGAVEDWLDAAQTQALQTAVERAAAAFPRSRSIGFDLILRERRSWVLEANAFGDLLPQLRWQGRDAYQDQAALTPAAHAPRAAA
ncbi:STM4014 family protein [Lysobacter firmicutimachus]|uniref:STM4014 family protein n=1 Tax=Lysobacter firmicutimachus TaxID=1792846 RepID=A0ABU8D288_9GAMM